MENWRRGWKGKEGIGGNKGKAKGADCMTYGILSSSSASSSSEIRSSRSSFVFCVGGDISARVFERPN